MLKPETDLDETRNITQEWQWAIPQKWGKSPQEFRQKVPSVYFVCQECIMQRGLLVTYHAWIFFETMEWIGVPISTAEKKVGLYRPPTAPERFEKWLWLRSRLETPKALRASPLEPQNERRKREDRSVEDSERSGGRLGLGRGTYAAPQPTWKSGERRELPAESGAEPRPPTHYSIF